MVKGLSSEEDEYERKKKMQLFAIEVREELKTYFKNKNDDNWKEKGQDGWQEVTRFMEEFEERDRAGLSCYMNLSSHLYPILWQVYCIEYS